LHCGRRPYLHDDLNTIKLSQNLIDEPPIELWPKVAVRVPIPQDVELTLIAPLEGDWLTERSRLKDGPS
jgi:hypothetical protein